MNIIGITAMIGAVTGPIGLVLNLLAYQRTKSHLKISVSDDGQSFFRRVNFTEEKFIGNFSTQAFAIIDLKMINKSTNPITITGIKIVDPDLEFPVRHITPFEIDTALLEFSLGQNQTTTYRLLPSFKLPIRLEAYDFTSGSVRLPFFADLVTSSPLSKKFTVLVSTSRKTYRLKLQLTDLQELFNQTYSAKTKITD